MKRDKTDRETCDQLRRALVRLLWAPVAEHAQCTCVPDDTCPLCQAMQALGFAKWVDSTDTKKCLAAEVIK